MARFECVDCPRLDTDEASVAIAHANYNNHCVVDNDHDDM